MKNRFDTFPQKINNVLLWIVVFFIFADFVEDFFLKAKMGASTYRLIFLVLFLAIAKWGFLNKKKNLSKGILTYSPISFLLIFQLFYPAFGEKPSVEFLFTAPLLTLVFFTIPFLIYHPNDEKNKILFASIFHGALLVAGDYVQFFYLENHPILEIYNKYYVFVKLIHIAIGCFLGYTFFQFSKRQVQYEEKLKNLNVSLEQEVHKRTS